MRIKRFIMTALAVVCGPAIALAIPTDASTQNQFTQSNGLTVRIDSPNENNGANGPDGRAFCTLYDGGRCLPINKSACDGTDLRTVRFVLSVATPIAANSKMYAFATTSDCTFAENIPPANVLLDSKDLLSNSPLVNGQAFDFPDDFASAHYATVADIASSIGACDEGTTIQNQRYRLCIGISVASGGVADTALESSEPIVYMTFLVDTVTPDAPTEFTAEGGDGSFRLRVGLANNDEVAKYIIRYREAPEGETAIAAGSDCSTWTDFKESESIRQGSTSDATDFTIEGVENDKTFEVCAAARDIAGNLGTFSTTQLVVTRNECDFIECYPGEPPTGYCGQVSGSLVGGWIVVGLLGRAFFRRRRVSSAAVRRVSLFGLVAVGLLGSSVASAQTEDAFIFSEGDVSHEEKRPQFGFELRFGPFKPSIGNSVERGAYNTVYGDDSSMFKNHPLMKQIEISWYPFTKYGVGGFFVRFGHWRASGKTRDCSETGGGCNADDLDTSVKGNDKTSLTVLPLTVGAVFKFDLLKEKFYIPLVPYAKAGFDYYLWFNSAAGKTSTASDGSKGRGGTPGINGSIGLALNLDWIEPKAAMSGRTGAGIADTYIFFEYTKAYSGFRSSGLEMSDTYGLVGLSIDIL